MGRKLSHSDLTTVLNSGWMRQKASNLNGFLFDFLAFFHYKEMGQWSEPAMRRMEAHISPPSWTKLSEIRSLSNHDDICYEPALFLFHV